MALLMKESCEKCGKGLEASAKAFICSYECTFCAACAAELKEVCPNCGGELVRRPTRRAKDERTSPRQASATTPFNAYIDG